MEGLTASLRLNLFGSLSVECNGAPLVGGLARKELWLLALLALRQGRAVTRDYLAGLLWPDIPEETALYNLRRSLNRLREALGAQADLIRPEKPRSLSLAVADTYVDAIEFDRIVTEKDPARLAVAVAIYRAPLLQDYYEDWVLAERLPREFAYRTALETLAADALTREDWTEAERYARLSIAADPLQEPAHRTLLAALARSGNYAAATLAYRDLRLRLREEANSEPARETKALFESIHREAQTTVAISPVSVGIVPARPGGHVPATQAPKAAPAEHARQPLDRVPIPLTRLIGREAERVELSAHLRSARLVTLAGPGGVGKTRLAIEAAREAAERFPDGQVLVSLAPLADGTLVIRALANALDVKEEPGRPLLSGICSWLQDRRLLIVLDNCEHLVAEVAALGRELLSTCPEVRLLVTSRQNLGLTGEVVFPVRPLAMPPAALVTYGKWVKSDLSGVLEYPSVQLFLERARATCPELRVGPAELEAIGRIVCRLDGIPLALELAAARTRALSIQQIATRVEDRFRLLRGGTRPENDHHQTLRALLDWSYNLLEEEERRLFAYLSVFAGGWTLEAAETVCGNASNLTTEHTEGHRGTVSPQHPIPNTQRPSDVLDLLTSLVDKSLVVADSQSAETRYTMLETIRQYARERLVESGQEGDARQRHRSCFIALVKQNSGQGSVEVPSDALDRLEREHLNLNVAQQPCTDRDEDFAERLTLAQDLSWYWSIRCYWQEGLDEFDRLFASPQFATISIFDRMLALNNAGNLATFQANYPRAAVMMESSVALCRTLGDPARLARGLHNLGTILWIQGDSNRARRCFDEVLDISIEISNLVLHGQALSGLGNCSVLDGDDETARVTYERSIERLIEANDEVSIAVVRGNLGRVLHRQGRMDEAQSQLEIAIDICIRHEIRPQEPGLQAALGNLFARQGQVERARDCFRRSTLQIRRLGSRLHLALLLERILPLCLVNDNPTEAVRLFAAGRALRRQIGLALSLAEKPLQDGDLDALQTLLGTAAFDAAWAHGERLTPEQAIELALEQTL